MTSIWHDASIAEVGAFTATGSGGLSSRKCFIEAILLGVAPQRRHLACNSSTASYTHRDSAVRLPLALALLCTALLARRRACSAIDPTALRSPRPGAVHLSPALPVAPSPTAPATTDTDTDPDPRYRARPSMSTAAATTSTSSNALNAVSNPGRQLKMSTAGKAATDAQRKPGSPSDGSQR